MEDFAIHGLMGMLPEAERDFIRAQAQRRSYRNGELVHERGDSRLAMGIVFKGRVKLTTPRSNGRESFVSFIDEGQHYGDVVIAGRSRRVHRAVAIGPTQVDHVSADLYRQMLGRPIILEALYVIATYRLASAIDLIDDLKTLPVDVLLSKLLLGQARTVDGVMRADFLQEDFANAMGVTTVTVAKAFARLKRAGFVQTGYRHAIVMDPAGLQVLIAEHDAKPII